MILSAEINFLQGVKQQPLPVNLGMLRFTAAKEGIY